MKRMKTEPTLDERWLIYRCEVCGHIDASAFYCEGGPVADAEPHPERLSKSMLVSRAIVPGSYDGKRVTFVDQRIEALERELRNVRAGVWAAQTYLDRREYGMVGIQLRGCLPDGYAPVGMGGDPAVACSTATDGGDDA